MEKNRIVGVPSPIVFWTVFVVVLIPSSWFVATSYIGLQDILAKLHATQSSQAIEYYKENRTDKASDLMIRAHLEYDSLWNRQGRTISFLATRTWLRFMSSAFGAILIFVGSIYLLCRIEASSSDMNADYGGFKFSVVSSSPGIIMLIVGATLMAIPNIVDQPIETIDGASYLLPFWGDGLHSDNSTRPSESPTARQVLKLIEEGS